MDSDLAVLILLGIPWVAYFAWMAYRYFRPEAKPESTHEIPSGVDPFFLIEERIHEFGLTVKGSCHDFEDITIVIRDASSLNAAKRRMREFLNAVRTERRADSVEIN